MDGSLCAEVVGLLKAKPALYDPLDSAVKIEAEHEVDDGWNGFEWHDLPAEPQTLRMLVLNKILKVSYKTRTRTHYRLTDLEAVQEGLKLTTIMLLDLETPSSVAGNEVPMDLFDDVVGYEDVKQLFLKSLYGEEEDQVHFLMMGPPASAKSLFLLCLERLPNAKYALGSRTTKAGLADYLATYKPQYLLVDEIDKMDGTDYAILLSLCSAGRITEIVYGRTREISLNIIVFAAGNRLKGIPPEVVSRFQVLHFQPYTVIEFMQVVTHVLTRRHIDAELAKYIGEKVYMILDSRDVRQALRVAKLAKTRRQVDRIVRTLSRYTGE